ncbi:LamG-like jellyroll fold domain-containing protein [Streptomyces sp. WI04-05B]|uniref:LamG-like jellyroll fold domain-containing protein n=1 Tax=Streptomyces echiniscabiei TaxID=3028708 RepID=UPI003B9C2062
MYDRVISDDEVRALFKQHPVVKGRWNFESASGSPATSPDSSAQNRPVTFYNGAKTGEAWVDSGALVLDGDNDYAATGSVPIDTSQSFTVTAWALAPSGRPQEAGVVLSQAGAVNSAFTVGYEPGPDDGDPSTPITTGRWRINMPDADTTSAGEATVTSTLLDEYSANGWNHLALVYDAFADQVKLYVNGQLEQFVCADDNADGTQDDPACTDHVSWADNTVGFNATKTLELGRAKTAGVWGTTGRAPLTTCGRSRVRLTRGRFSSWRTVLPTLRPRCPAAEPQVNDGARHTRWQATGRGSDEAVAEKCPQTHGTDCGVCAGGFPRPSGDCPVGSSRRLG